MLSDLVGCCGPVSAPCWQRHHRAADLCHSLPVLPAWGRPVLQLLPLPKTGNICLTGSIGLRWTFFIRTLDLRCRSLSFHPLPSPPSSLWLAFSPLLLRYGDKQLPGGSVRQWSGFKSVCCDTVASWLVSRPLSVRLCFLASLWGPSAIRTQFFWAWASSSCSWPGMALDQNPGELLITLPVDLWFCSGSAGWWMVWFSSGWCGQQEPSQPCPQSPSQQSLLWCHTVHHQISRVSMS